MGCPISLYGGKILSATLFLVWRELERTRAPSSPKPECFMNWCYETTKMAVPPCNRPAYRGIGSEAYLNGTSQGPTAEDARKDGHIRGRSKRFMKHPGYKSKKCPHQTERGWLVGARGTEWSRLHSPHTLPQDRSSLSIGKLQLVNSQFTFLISH